MRLDEGERIARIYEMNKNRRLHFACLLLGALCCPSVWAASPNAKGSATDGPFEQLVDDFVLGTLALAPSTATGFGYHVHHGTSLDDMLDDFSPAGIAASRNLTHDIEARIARLDTASLDAEQRADIDVMHDALGASRLELDEIQSYRHNPTSYVELLGNALYTPYVLQYAPAPQRYRHIINRLNKVPELIRQAEANLQDSPEVWNRVARDENTGNIGLVDTTLRADCPPEERMRYDQAAATAIAALHGFNHWLEDHLAEKSSDWRLGKERYAKKFRLVLATGKTPEALLADNGCDLHAVGQAGTGCCNGLRQVQGFADPPAQCEFGGHRDAGVHARHLRRRRIQSRAGAGAEAGSVLLGDADSARVAAVARRFEAARVQRFGNAASDRARGHAGSLCARGVCERSAAAIAAQQLMAEQGYLGDTPGYRLTLQKQLLRVLANTILDVRLQTMGMTDQEALDLMTKSTYQEMEEATAKLQRAKLSSCQLPTYYAGYKGWLTLREHYQAKRGAAFSLKEFHESALRQGAVPLPVLERLLQ